MLKSYMVVAKEIASSVVNFAQDGTILSNLLIFVLSEGTFSSGEVAVMPTLERLTYTLPFTFRDARYKPSPKWN